MKLGTVRTEDGTQAVRLDGERLVGLGFRDVGAVFEAGGPDLVATADNGFSVSPADADLAPPVPSPEKIVCVGLNYRAHAEEAGLGIPEYPTLFAKYARALVGPADPIVLPADASLPDWEAELGIVIGREVRRADREQARASIGGYTVVNDVSMRDWQRRSSEWLQGKTFEATTPVGPFVVTLDEIDDPDDLSLTCEIDGEIVQDARTGDMIFGPAEIVSYVSQIITLVPGDLIATGTPSGIGSARKPPRSLTPGQTVKTSLAGVGELVNTCVSEV
jgi:acylpyruvate hydrolase